MSEALNVSINELLEAENSNEEQLTSQQISGDVLERIITYADRFTIQSIGRKGKLLAGVLTFLLLLGSIVSIIVDVVINHQLTWSVIVIASCIMAAGCLLPLLCNGMKGTYLSLGLFSIILIPLLFIIEWFTRNYGGIEVEWAMSIGVPNAICWILVFWICLGVFKMIHVNKWMKIGICLLIVMIGELFTNIYSHQRLEQWELFLDNMLSVIAFIACAAGAFYVGWRKQQQ